jgi:hypothetical protein
MGKINSRAKGAAGEREFIKELALELGDELVAPLKRNLEQTRAGGHDIEGLEGFAIEIKRYKQIKEGDLAKFWDQAVDQAHRISAKPVLAYREDFKSWRVRVRLTDLVVDSWFPSASWSIIWTAEISMTAFAGLVREQHSATHLHKAESPATLAA